jgi:hypothetical protein
MQPTLRLGEGVLCRWRAYAQCRDWVGKLLAG